VDDAVLNRHVLERCVDDAGREVPAVDGVGSLQKDDAEGQDEGESVEPWVAVEAEQRYSQGPMVAMPKISPAR
jgi:hypothetical protein